MKKKIIGWLMASACALTMLAGCGNQQEKAPATEAATEAEAAEPEKKVETVDPSEEAAEEEETNENELTVCTTKGTTFDILNQAVKPMKDAGITLTIYEEADYLYPNLYVDGEIADANYFQHTVYLDYFNQMMDTDIVGVGEVHFEPLAIYPARCRSLNDLKDGDTIVIPGDTTNETRALKLLEKAGLLSFRPDAGEYLKTSDISANPHNISVVPEDASKVASRAGDAALLVMNGNYAASAFYSLEKDALFKEDPADPDVQKYWNIVATRSDLKDDPKVKKLVEVLQSDEIKDYINSSFSGAAVTN